MQNVDCVCLYDLIPSNFGGSWSPSRIPGWIGVENLVLEEEKGVAEAQGISSHEMNTIDWRDSKSRVDLSRKMG